MLILSRKVGESFYIQDELFTIVNVSKQCITLAFSGGEYTIQVKDWLDLNYKPVKLNMCVHNIRTNPAFNKVVLGFEGPVELVVLREELKK